VLAPHLWAAIGAAATRLYMPERMTNDLDVLIHRKDSEAIRAQLAESGASYQGELRISGSLWRLSDEFPLDVIESDEAWVEQALTEAKNNRDPQAIPVLPLPYLVLMKFRASRVQALADITRMLGQATMEQCEQVRAIFSRWLPDEQEDLESLIELGRLEMGTAEIEG
jgi:hypothetical protein